MGYLYPISMVVFSSFYIKKRKEKRKENRIKEKSEKIERDENKIKMKKEKEKKRQKLALSATVIHTKLSMIYAES